MSNLFHIPLSAPAPKPAISVIMVSYRTGPALLEAITAVRNDRDIFELILVDNGNSPGARARLSQHIADMDKIRLLQGHGNIGFAKGCNYGAAHAKGDVFLFLNPDALIAKGAARRMADCGTKLSTPWITGGLLRTPDGREQRGSRRLELTPWRAFTNFTGLSKLSFVKSIHMEDDPLPHEAMAVPVISGACLMTDRASFEKIGGFDESYFLHVEDIEICRRTRRMGGEVWFVPGATVMHYGSTSKITRMALEWEKLKGFLRYFRTYTDGPLSNILTAIASPFIALAVMGRAFFLALRAGLFGR